MTNPQAAIGVAQLGRMEAIFARNRRLEMLYREYLGELPGVAFHERLPAGDEVSTWLVSLLVPPTQRRELIDAARLANIELRPFFYPLSQMPPYRTYGRDWPTSRGLSLSGLCLPTSHVVDEMIVKRLRDVFWKVLGRQAA